MLVMNVFIHIIVYWFLIQMDGAQLILMNFLIILLVSWLFYTAMTHSDANR